ncbi:uncharacterized protein LACBIDRAFT_330590 [Laccaria bicolor S238N-H82]|uniref:Predicted protein n=1 Tax=Laccaria bicolor (strain S238N-H82 / ATCC MYA-4686) TaxID=486041 RepID=B0DLT7_LACBS|nr:uncharacterized protein LACBIDRAFT_330590 [Laccaria bicolor S238N-H82]EDR04350.1 predicted protein [Laccaria bicolor S238N-H82]|eukprot:XP_001884869.1 predicted protein [Laccaria bicolor S238N-H82]
MDGERDFNSGVASSMRWERGAGVEPPEKVAAFGVEGTRLVDAVEVEGWVWVDAFRVDGWVRVDNLGVEGGFGVKVFGVEGGFGVEAFRVEDRVGVDDFGVEDKVVADGFGVEGWVEVDDVSVEGWFGVDSLWERWVGGRTFGVEGLVGLDAATSGVEVGDRERLCLDSFAQIEKSLLEGLAHDALAAVREHIKHKKAYLQLKDEVICNQGANTRAQGILKRVQNLTLTHANRYNFIRERLLLLGLSANDSTFQPLSTKDDLWMYSFNTSRTRRSEGLEPWYWTMRPVVDHVRWFRQRTLRDRHREEANILKEEFERTLRSFAAMSRAWSQTIQVSEEQSILGANAYAAKISAMYQEMHEKCKQSYLLAIATHTEAGVELRGGLYHGLQLEIRQSVMRQISLAIPNTHVSPSTASSIKRRSFWDH